MLFTGCSDDDPERLTGYFSGDYQVSGYISNEPFQVLDLVMINGGFVLVINRMHDDVIPASQAQVLLNGTQVSLNRFPLDTAEQSVYSLANIAFAPGKKYELQVNIGGQILSSSFRTPTTLYDVEITYAGIEIKQPSPAPPLKLNGDYVPGYAVDVEWQYTGGAVPYLVLIKAVDQYTGGLAPRDALLDYAVLVDGTKTEHTLSADVTRFFSNDLRIWVSIPMDASWTLAGPPESIFVGSSVQFVDPMDAVTLEVICRDLDGDDYGNPASPVCPFTQEDCDDSDPNVNPGKTEGPIGSGTCIDGLDNNCNGLTDSEDPGCQVDPPTEG